jgi:hypothetical protein
MSNVTAKPGQMASFKCQVDMSCIVAYIEWYHEMDNGTEKLIKVGINVLQYVIYDTGCPTGLVYRLTVTSP